MDTDQTRQDLADNLRVLVAAGTLDAEQARAVYASMYGVRETDEEFGPEVPAPRGRHEKVPATA